MFRTLALRRSLRFEPATDSRTAKLARVPANVLVARLLTGARSRDASEHGGAGEGPTGEARDRRRCTAGLHSLRITHHA